MVRDPRAKELANLKEALANFEYQLDAFAAPAEYRSKASPPPCLAPADPQIAFANEVVPACSHRAAQA